ncbi:hypothetical protein [Nocardia terpenica]|uniref:hypothetical protein n=1 Tax=Nocardia terpenica TaxID=455432 RepID=UPI000835C629|nr:hypothetical protein [Nocardia terpenica]NQE89784.1 hypothetical protein [Nocardia terpenica]
MSGSVLWDTIFGGNATRILKALYGSFLVRDYFGPATSVANFTPFDPDDGNLSKTLMTTDGFRDVGLLSEQGCSFTPKYTTVDTMVWQSRQAQRTDVTVDQEECLIQCAESTVLVDYLHENLPLKGMPANGTPGYRVVKPKVPQVLYRQVLALGVDGSSGDNEYFATLYARALMIKPEKVDWSAKQETLTSLTFDSYPCPYSGFSVARFREGPAWRASGGTTGAPGTPVATAGSNATVTLEFTPPHAGAGPFTYTVNKLTGPTPTITAVPANLVTVTSSSGASVVLTVTGQTVGETDAYSVQATGANGSQSVPSTQSNPVTIKS